MVEHTRGLDIVAGFAREASVLAPTWPAAAPALLPALLPMLSIDGNDAAQQLGSHGTVSGLGPLRFDPVSKTPTVTLPFRLTYQGFEQLWACALGHGAKRLASVVMPQTLATGAYRHLYELDASLSTAVRWDATADGFSGGELAAGQRKVRRGTLAVNYQVSTWEWLSAMVQGVTLTVTPTGVTLAVDFVSHSLNRDSAVNTVAHLWSVPPGAAPAVNPADAVVRVGAYSPSTPLGSGDILTATSWTLRLDNHLKASYGPRTGLAPEEYERDQDPTVTVTFVVPRHRNDLWQQRWNDATVLMADLRFVGPQIGSTGVNYGLSLYLPSCQVTNAHLSTAGAGLPSDVLQLIGTVPAAPAASFPVSQHAGPFFVELKSGVSQHALL